MAKIKIFSATRKHQLPKGDELVGLRRNFFHEIVTLEPEPETLILPALFLARSFDLHEVGNHYSIISVET
ncbi:MAG: hypothetical protein JO138_03700 [Acidobacteriaceae bacterium]|nr:hypothetical protein [Acidobacteriaceae bacterium]